METRDNASISYLGQKFKNKNTLYKKEKVLKINFYFY